MRKYSMNLKITEQHLAKPAYVYIRQSTMGQVRFHQESTQRQYALKDTVIQMGWTPQLVLTLDGDLGISGAQTTGRQDFKTLIADVTMGEVGAVVALEASRLARSSADWYRLIELCSLTSTLIIDEDGCYDPADFNDGLLLGLKGTMSQAELHFLRARLQGGKLNKARKGELRFPLPVGFCFDDAGQIVLDPDQEVQGAIRLVFSSFKQTGSAYGVLQQFCRQGLQFPKRSYGGIWDGKIIWGRLSHSRVLGVLKNPSYAGVYAFGRYRSKKAISPDGEVRTSIKAMPIGTWLVDIKDHHEAYIDWDAYLRNQTLLEANRTNGEDMVLSGPAREGLTLLQGLLLCGACGHKISIRYQGNGGIRPAYECNWLRVDGRSTRSCLSIRAEILDDAISKRVMEVLQPAQLELAVSALQELERRDQVLDKQWEMRIQKAEYEAQLAERRYEEVDPANRLVAGTLEQRWNDALVRLQDVRQQFEQQRQSYSMVLTAEQKTKALALGQDLPLLWMAPTTEAKDRKRLLRLLIKDITVEREKGQRQITLHVRWQGGAVEDLVIQAPLTATEAARYPPEVVDKVRTLAQTLTDDDIAEALNQQGCRPSKADRFTGPRVRNIRQEYHIPRPDLKRPEELTVKAVAQKFNVSPLVVYYWLECGTLEGRKLNAGSQWWITISPEKEAELCETVETSTKIRHSRARSANKNP
jgi:DNA invertase Pin-like site-specific DNA recombinase